MQIGSIEDVEDENVKRTEGESSLELSAHVSYKMNHLNFGLRWGVFPTHIIIQACKTNAQRFFFKWRNNEEMQITIVLGPGFSQRLANEQGKTGVKYP